MSSVVENGQIVLLYLGLIFAIVLFFGLAYWLWKKIPTAKEERERQDKLSDKVSGVPNADSRFRQSVIEE